MTRPRITALLILVLFIVYNIGNARVALWDRDEPRYAQTSRQMLQSGDWVVPRYLDKVRTAKPVFIYWCQATAMSVLGDNSFAARLPNAIATALTLALIAYVIRREIDGEHAVWTTIILGTAAMIIAWCARNAVTDGVLLLFITTAQCCLYSLWKNRAASWRMVAVWSLATGLAVLTKGPVPLGIQATTLLALFVLNRAKPSLPFNLSKILVGTAIVAVIVAPWVMLVERRAPGFLYTTVAHDVVQRTLEPLEQHKGPPGYYLATIWGTFFPWSLFLPMTMWNAWKQRHNPAIRFALAAVVGPWVMFELVQTKLPHYMLPTFPPLAFLTADALVRGFRRELPDFFRRSFMISVTIWSLIVLAIGIMPWLFLRSYEPRRAVMIAWTTIATLYAITVFVCFFMRRPKLAAAAMAAGMVAAMLIAFAWFLPDAQFLRLSVHVADILKREGATTPGQVEMIEYKEPSLAFYQGGTIREQPDSSALARPAGPRWTTVRSDIWDQQPPEVQAQWQIVASAQGVNVADRGRRTRVLVLRRNP